MFQHESVMVPPGNLCLCGVSGVPVKMFIHDLYYLGMFVFVCAARCCHRLPVKSAHVGTLVPLSSGFRDCSPITCSSMPISSLITLRTCLLCPAVCSLLYSGTQLLIKARLQGFHHTFLCDNGDKLSGDELGRAYPEDQGM